MAELKQIQTPLAPAAIGPYSQAIRSGSMVFLSGQIPLHPETMALVDGGIEAQTRQVFKNLAAVAAAADSDLQHAVKITIYLTDLNDFATADVLSTLRTPVASVQDSCLHLASQGIALPAVDGSNVWRQ